MDTRNRRRRTNNNIKHSRIANLADLTVHAGLGKLTHLLVRSAIAKELNIGDIVSLTLLYSSSIF